MVRHSMRLSVAVLTFTLGIAIFWTVGLIAQVETSFVDRFFKNSDIGPVNLVRFNADEDSNEIYRLLVHRKLSFHNGIKLIVLQAETIDCPTCRDESFDAEIAHTMLFRDIMNELMPEAELQTLDSYLLNNKTRQELKISNLGVNYVLVKNSDLPDGTSGDFWTRFYKRYPNSSGLLSFSQVGFNDRHDQAFVCVGRSCGGLCGGAEYYLLNKVNGTWEILAHRLLWVS